MVKTKDELEKTLRAFIELVVNSFQVEAVVLFGSYAGDNPGIIVMWMWLCSPLILAGILWRR